MMSVFSTDLRNRLLERAVPPLEGPFEVVAGSNLLRAYPELGPAIDHAKRVAGHEDNVQIIDSGTGEVLFDDRDKNPSQQLLRLRKRL